MSSNSKKNTPRPAGQPEAPEVSVPTPSKEA